MAQILKQTTTLTAAAAGNYDANDVIAASATNNAGTAISFAVGGECLIVGLSAVCSEDSVLNRLRLHLFNDEPAAAEVEMDDAAAFAITTSTKYAGYIDLPAFADAGGVATAQNMTVRFPVKLATSSGKLYAVVETLDAETNETAAMTIRFDLLFIPFPL